MAELKYENIAVLTPTKKRFLKQYQQAKKRAETRHFYMDDYLNSLLDKEQA
jgi:hypothetical protein